VHFSVSELRKFQNSRCNDENYKQAGCLILIAFPLQQWLQERALVLSYFYISCNVASTMHVVSVSGHAGLALDIYRGLLGEFILTFCVLKFVGHRRRA